jgi:hypothetical protein
MHAANLLNPSMEMRIREEEKSTEMGSFAASYVSFFDQQRGFHESPSRRSFLRKVL